MQFLAVRPSNTRRPYTRRVRRRRWNGRVGLALILLGLAVVGLNIRETLDPVVVTLTGGSLEGRKA